MSYTRFKTVNFGSAYTGLSTVAYQTTNSADVVQTAWTTTGVFELLTGSGIYGASVDFEDTFRGSIEWRTSSTGVYAAEEVNPESDANTPPTVQSGLPSESELEDYLTAHGLLSDPRTDAQELLDLAVIAAAAVSEWERITRWKPFVAAADNSSRFFDVPDIYNSRLAPGGGRMLDLRAGITSINYVKLDDETLTQDTDWEPFPLCALDNDRPYTHIEIISCRRGASRRAIEISGRWGYCLSDAVPSDVYQAILDIGARLASFSLRSLLTGGGADKVKQGPVEYTFGGSASSGGGSWFSPVSLNARIDAAALNYRRQTLA